jgi:hypothetical protein
MNVSDKAIGEVLSTIRSKKLRYQLEMELREARRAEWAAREHWDGDVYARAWHQSSDTLARVVGKIMRAAPRH